MHFHPERRAVSINQQPMLTKALRSPLSSRAKPRDLQRRSTNPQPRPRRCHPLVAIAAISDCYSSVIRSPLVIPTRISCYAALDKAACAPFSQGKADAARRRHQAPREIRGSEAEGSAVPRTLLGDVFRQT
jgi:hypothetical protein